MQDSLETQHLKDIFPAFEPELIQFILKNGSIKQFEENEIIIQSGQFVRSILLVLEGSIKLYREDEEGNEFFIYYLHAGQACVLSLLCTLRHESLDIIAKAHKNTQILSIPIEKAEELAKLNPSWTNFVFRSYRERFEELLETIDRIAFKSMDERLEFYLKRQFKVNGNRLQATHQEIAQDLATSREVVSRLLKNMEKAGLVELQRNLVINKSL